MSITTNREVKQSFVTFLSRECEIGDLRSAASMRPDPSPDRKDGWAGQNPMSVICAQRVAAYAVDQCEIITLHQNEVAMTVNTAIGALSIGSALATTAYAFKGSTSDRTAATALAGTVSANNAGRSFLPGNQATPVKAMFDASPVYAEATGLTDDDFTDAAKGPGEDARLMLARTHDAVLSNCTANAFGRSLPKKPR